MTKLILEETKISLAQPNVDGTPNLQDTTTFWDLEVKQRFE
jgi:hypothetical protein